MKQVLIIDETPLFREYLGAKLEDNDIDSIIAISASDGITKMRNNAPDLIILDYHLGRQGFMEVLRQKKLNLNSVNTPVIIVAQKIDQKRLIELIPYSVRKVFTKPVKIDTLLATLSELLGVKFEIDDSPGIVEVHVNDNIIFIELAKGLNRDKLELLRFKLVELVELYEIKVPKVIVMLSNIKLGYADSPNLQKLLETILQATRAKLNFIKVLTNDDFIRKYIGGQKAYASIEVVSNLQFAMDGLLSEIDRGADTDDKKAEIISDRLLQAKDIDAGQAMALKFDAEDRPSSADLLRESLQNLKIAVIDDDFIIQELIKNTFQKTGAQITCYPDGEAFLAALDTTEFDLAFLDINMPKVDGFAVLNALQARDLRYNVIILSSVTQRETVIKAFQMGIKSYLFKPLKPEDIFKKTLETLKTNF